MTDKRQHRGAHPEDARAFAPEMLGRLAAACADLCWLLSRGYSEKAASTLAGDRYALTDRQRMAVRRCACSDQDLELRRGREVSVDELTGALVQIDGFNVITTVESALSDAVILEGRDGCYRDLASMHGNFKHVTETPQAILLIGRTLARLGTRAHWFLDQPVSNSGRLKQLILETAAAEGWAWTVELAQNPDGLLAASSEIIATADSAVLNRCKRWVNLARLVVREHAPDAEALVLSRKTPQSVRTQGEQMPMTGSPELRLSASRAFLGSVHPEMRRIEVAFDGLCIVVTVTLDREPSERVREDISVAATEIIADFPEGYQVAERIVTADGPLPRKDIFEHGIFYERAE